LTIVNVADPTNPSIVSSIDFSAAPFGFTNDVNSVAARGGIVAVAVANATKTEPGRVFLLDTSGNLLKELTVGALPDMLTFTPDGKKILVANEGERTATTDAPGSVSIIDVSSGAAAATVTTAGFEAFDGKRDQLVKQGVRIFEGKTVANDVEPEYIAVAPDGKTALVVLQEANAVATLDIVKGRITKIQPLGLKKFEKLAADFSDRDGGYTPVNAKVFGMYMPDAIASFTSGGKTFYAIANEGDDRDDFIDGGEKERLGDLTLDPRKFPNAEQLQADTALGRLNTPNPAQVGEDISGDTDGDGDIDQILSYGARSFSILNSKGKVVFDSGEHIERFIAENTSLFADSRSDDKGPEPEGVTIGVVGAATLAFVGLERSSAVMVYDVTKVKDVEFVGVLQRAGDVSPEGLTFVSAADSPTGVALLGVTNEVSGTLTLFGL
jgi:DNA-binding beta-propeller fold protein YncE